MLHNLPKLLVIAYRSNFETPHTIMHGNATTTVTPFFVSSNGLAVYSFIADDLLEFPDRKSSFSNMNVVANMNNRGFRLRECLLNYLSVATLVANRDQTRSLV